MFYSVFNNFGSLVKFNPVYFVHYYIEYFFFLFCVPSVFFTFFTARVNLAKIVKFMSVRSKICLAFLAILGYLNNSLTYIIILNVYVTSIF